METHRHWMLSRIGYGNLDSSYWFLGMEERGQPDEIHERMRGGYLDDVRDVHVNGFSGRYRHLFEGKKPATQPTWRKLIRTLLVAKNGQATLEDVRAYQAQHWGRIDGETLLAELFPLAAPKLSTDEYKAELLPHRVRLFRELHASHRPRFVVAYGQGYWDHYKAIFGNPTAKWMPLAPGCGPGWTCGNVALVQHPTLHGMTNARFEALGRWAHQFVR